MLHFLTKLPLAALLFYAYGFWYFILRILGFNLEFLPGDLGDSRFINYILEHGYRFLSGKDDSFWNAPFMQPYPNAIALSDNLLGTLPIYSLYRYFNFSIFDAYQLWWISLISLNFWLCYAVLAKWIKAPIIAAMIAFVFAFGVYNINQLNYTQVMARFCVPPAIYCAYLLVTQSSTKHLFLYCFTLVLQFYCAIYFGFFLFYFTILFMIVLSLVNKDLNWLKFYFSKKQIIRSLLIVGFSVFLLFILFLPYFKSVNDVGLKLYKDSLALLPTLQSYFFAHDALISYNFLNQHGKISNTNWWLQNIFPGFFVYLGFIAFGVYLLYLKIKKQKTDSLILSLFLTTALIFIVFTRIYGDFTFYFTVFKLPGMNSLKVLTRFLDVQILFLLLLSGLFLLKISKQNQMMVFLIAIIFCLSDNLFSPDKVARFKKEEAKIRLDKTQQELSQNNLNRYKSVAGLVQTNEKPAYRHLDMMLASQQLDIPCVNGYSSSCKDEFNDFFIRCDSAGLEKWINFNGIHKDSLLVLK